MSRMYWRKMSQKEIQDRIFEALSKNVDYEKQIVLGLPASYLDDKVFHQDASFLKDAPFMTALVQNPNHIGCHTIGSSEKFFKGTQEIERELIEICAVDILDGKPQQQDGYVASGGTEANMQAIWIYRNYFQREKNAENSEICILCSEDSHYSLNKAANILSIQLAKVKVDENSREVRKEEIAQTIREQQESGIKYFIVVANMMTTMFGSVDAIDNYVDELENAACLYKIHIDGAYGGFYYPFSDEENILNFGNPNVSSVTLDAHKMAQAPYGTGIFLIRKGFMQYAVTKEASYIEGQDYTLIGSRSGANAISIWMILMKNGPFGWREKIYILQKRAEWLCENLEELKIGYYRHPNSNIVTIRSRDVSKNIAGEFGLVPDDHMNPKWYKIVVMEHVTIEKLIPLINKLDKNRK